MGRFVGVRGSRFSLQAFSDASRLMIGCVVFIRDEISGEVNFVLAKNRIVGTNLDGKSIPALELHALSFTIETLFDIYKELTGSSSVIPIDITSLYCYFDSMCALNWVNSSVNKINKMRKLSPFVMNRLQAMEKLCTTKPVQFGFIARDEFQTRLQIM